MSDFLLNLARRSAGLAPVVRARSVPLASMPSDGPGDLEAIGGARSSEPPPAPAAVVTPAGASPVAVDTPQSEATPTPLAAPSASAATLVVQRAPLLASAAPASPAPATPAAVPESAEPAPAPAAPREWATLEPAGADRAATVVEPTPQAAQPAASRWIGEPPPEAQVTMVVPAPRGESDHSMAATPQVAPDPTVAPERPTIIERVVEPAAPAALERAAVLVEPAPAAATGRAALAWSEPIEERTVHVRIGAIEIHATEPPSSALVATAPAPAAPQASPATGFDDFARLRSYAPWEW